jgi:hypothetical protein
MRVNTVRKTWFALLVLGASLALAAGCGESIGVGADSDAQRTLDETVMADTMADTMATGVEQTPTGP